MWKRGTGEQASESERFEEAMLPALKRRRGLHTKECRGLLEGNSPKAPGTHCPYDPFQTSDLQNGIRCFKSLSS
jgi:hypothetical protein